MEYREKIITKLMKGFVADLIISAKPLTDSNDLIYFIEKIIEYGRGMQSIIPLNDYLEQVDFDGDDFIRQNLLKKFRNKMAPFLKSNLKNYFDKEAAVKDELFKTLKIEEPLLTYDEQDYLMSRIYGFLYMWLDSLLLLPENSKVSKVIELKELPAPQQDHKIKNPEFTRKRQGLMFYYLLRLIDTDIRQSSSMAAVTRFGHALFNWPYTNINNAGLYDIVKELPYIKADKFLLLDLEFCQKAIYGY